MSFIAKRSSPKLCVPFNCHFSLSYLTLLLRYNLYTIQFTQGIQFSGFLYIQKCVKPLLQHIFELFKKIFVFDVDHFLEVFIEFVTILLLFCVLFFWPQCMWHLSYLTGIEPAPPALEGKVLTTGPPGKSHEF